MSKRKSIHNSNTKSNIQKVLPDQRPFDLEDSHYLQPSYELYEPPPTILVEDANAMIELVRLETDDAARRFFDKIFNGFFKLFEIQVALRVAPEKQSIYRPNFINNNNNRISEIFELIKSHYFDIRSKYNIKTHDSDLPPLDFITFYKFYVVSVLYTFCGVSHLMSFNLKPILRVLNTLVPDEVISRPMKIKIMNYMNIQVASTFSELSSIRGGRRRQTNNKITKKHKKKRKNTIKKSK